MSKKTVDDALEAEVFPAPPEELPVGVQPAEAAVAPEPAPGPVTWGKAFWTALWVNTTYFAEGLPLIITLRLGTVFFTDIGASPTALRAGTGAATTGVRGGVGTGGATSREGTLFPCSRPRSWTCRSSHEPPNTVSIASTQTAKRTRFSRPPSRRISTSAVSTAARAQPAWRP